MGSVVPWTKTELCFKDLEEHHYTTYAHLFDKQLCQYLALNKDTNLKNKEEIEFINSLISINLYSIAELTLAITDSHIISSDNVAKKGNCIGCVPLQTYTTKEISTVSLLNKTKQNCKPDLITYAVGDLILFDTNILLRFSNEQDFLLFNLKECLKTEWINSMRLVVKPTR